MQEVWQYPFFSISNMTFTVGQTVMALLLVALIFIIYRALLKQFFPKVFVGTEISEKENNKLRKLARGLVFIVLGLAIIISFKLNFLIHSFQDFNLTIVLIVKALLFIQFARLLDWFVSNVFIHGRYLRRDKQTKVDEKYAPTTEQSAKKIVQYIFYVVVLLFALNNFGIDFTLFDNKIGEDVFYFKLSNIVKAVLVILIAQLIVWIVTQLFLYTFYKNRDLEVGSQYAINQLVKYVIYIFAFIFCLKALGLDMNIVLGGAAALLVGLGLGLQQTFNDLISGIVILFERSTSVGDVLEFDGTIGTVKKIGLRASTLETRDNVSIVVPNHLLVNEKVKNWNHYNDKVRFTIDIGVAYGSDTTLVKTLLMSAVENNPYVIKYPAPFVRFRNFGESSLDFSLFFFSRNYLVIEDIKSDIRLEIDRLFRENSISIPFPQSEITIKRP